MNEPDQPASHPHAEDTGSPALTTAPVPMFVCPYCGSPTPDQPRCPTCRGFLDPLSRQASQNAMGPWSIRSIDAPFQAGCSYETIVMLVRRGRVSLDSVLRGPTTAQFWCPAKRVPGVAHLLGLCHSCGTQVDGDETHCPECHADFTHPVDRQALGLMPVRPLPGQPASPSGASAFSDADRSRPEAGEQSPSGGAEGGGGAGGGLAGGAPSASTIRHIRALETNVKSLWVWLVVALAGLGVVLAITAAAALSGAVKFEFPGSASAKDPVPGMERDPTSGGTPAVTPEKSAAPAPEQPKISPKDPGKDQSTPAAPAGESAKPAEGAPAESEMLRHARQLIQQDTEESLQEAVRILQEAIGGGDRTADAQKALTAARTRLAQRAMKGQR